MKSCIMTGLAFFCLLLISSTCPADEKIYVGSIACRDCHEKEYSNYTRFAKKARSFESIKKMENKLTNEEYVSCFECHTTGYGKKGGFISEEKTPELKDAGCEVCHGPGSLHAENGDPALIIRKISMDNCNSCHSNDRIEAFDFKPLLFGGAH